MGPTETDPGSGEVPASGDNQFVRATANESPVAIASRLDRLSAEATRQEQSLQELQAYFQDQKSLLASIPSIWPTRGWVTSDFGHRLDPYTADQVMHAGLDIAAPHGKDVHAPADGTVVFAGLEGGYGNVLVIDHGYGIKTRYGHLSAILVKPGDKVTRGQKVALVGNTGRSTGPHLHYEVRVNGIAQNPRKFILDE
ncbi:MAG: M23 family metallopeptidase [Myxococcaceae bacterium]|nr:M23 family metallopeptidase [Myxococcaceae bacterium]